MNSPLRLLLLPDLRQNTRDFHRKTKKFFDDLQDVASVHLLSPSSLYKRVGKSSRLCVSLKHIDDVFRSAGPFHGLIGFAVSASLRLVAHPGRILKEGATLGALLSGIQPWAKISFRFVILFSGSMGDREEIVSPVHLPSLLLFNNDDDRAGPFVHLFAQPTVVNYSGSPFSPKNWPFDRIRDFLLSVEIHPEKPPSTFDEKLRALIVALRAGLSRPTSEDDSLDEQILSVWSQRKRFFANENNDETSPFASLWIDVYRQKPDEVRQAFLRAVVDFGGWNDLVHIALLAQQHEDLQRTCRTMIVEELQRNVRDVSTRKDSRCADQLPLMDKASSASLKSLAKEIGECLSLDHGGDLRGIDLYQSVIRRLRRQSHKSSLIFLDEKVRRPSESLFCTRKPRDSASLPSKVLHPQPTPIAVSALHELEPLLAHLSSNKAGPSLDEHVLVFPRGTIFSDGRLDLCKQAVGPQGIRPLLNAMEHNAFVTRLLLGNNLVGRTGAEAIAEFLGNASARSSIETWYIACNHFDERSMELICNALLHDTHVKDLWLKRNPILPQGTTHLARLLTNNAHLQTLDLFNTGLLDDGCRILFDAFKVNRSLKHLYIDSNGLTHVSALVIREHFEKNDNQLETLYLSCNLFADRGTEEIAQGLIFDRHLRRFSLASNSMGDAGLKALVDALVAHPSLHELNIGWMKSSTVLGGLENHFADDGAAQLARLIQFNAVLRTIDVNRNAIGQRGVIQLRDALKSNVSLTTLRGLTGKDRMINKEIRSLLQQNRIRWGEEVLGKEATVEQCRRKGDELDELVRCPPHLSHVVSYYRTQ